jgi:predicted DNA-binding transcriptional regulator AlpA
MADELDIVWDAGDCAAFLKFSRKHFHRDVRHREGFPKPLAWSSEAQPRWSSKAVRAWALRPDYATAA